MVKDREKGKLLAISKEEKEIESSIQDLLSARTSGILIVEEAYLLSHLKANKGSLLAHQIVT